jgi:hypothetical protein
MEPLPPPPEAPPTRRRRRVDAYRAACAVDRCTAAIAPGSARPSRSGSNVAAASQPRPKQAKLEPDERPKPQPKPETA